mmetsp:Transcript_13947/g.41544  ORF Transcript_13947/g.41544 Transcript_13947/m.41544 type:complete len:356 (-) Transcript_13947:28-1095(-)
MGMKGPPPRAPGPISYHGSARTTPTSSPPGTPPPPAPPARPPARSPKVDHIMGLISPARPSSITLASPARRYSVHDDDAPPTPLAFVKKTALGPTYVACVRCLLVFSFLEDGFRMITRGDEQARLLLGRRASDVAIRRGAMLSKVAGLAHVVGSAAVVFTARPRFAVHFMIVLLVANSLVFGLTVPRTAHVHGVAAYACRCLGSFGGLSALSAHADAERLAESRRSSWLEDPNTQRATRRRIGYVNLMARVFLAGYFAFSGVLLEMSWWVRGVAIVGGLLMVFGFMYMTAAPVMAVLMMSHGLIPYPPFYRYETVVRDALFFAFAQDVSVFGALVLLATVGPGPLSVDAWRAKRA